jgi:hypothetical protein
MVNPKAKNSDLALKFAEFCAIDGADFWSDAVALPLTSGKVSDNAHPVIKKVAEYRKQGRFVHNGDFTLPFNTEFNTRYRQTLLTLAESIVNGGTLTPEQCLENMQRVFDNARATR